MAVAPKYIPINRRHVRKWLIDWRALDPATRPTLRDYIQQQVDALNLTDPYVDVRARDDYFDDFVHIVRNIMDDIGSYG